MIFKKVVVFLMILGVLLLAACQSDTPDPTATPQPTSPPATAVAPIEEQAPEPTEAVSEVEADMLDLDVLTAHPWQWTSFTSPVEEVTVEMPESYLLTFNSDGAVSVKADCNNASGGYTADATSLTIQMGPMTMAACPEGSRSDQFVTLLGGAANYFFEDGQLYIDLVADGGTMVLAPSDNASVVTEYDSANQETEIEFCALFDLPFPRPEPAYTGKLERDFTPFAAALDAYTPEEAAAREALVSGKTIPELQTLMDEGQLSSVELVVYYLDRIQRYDVDKLNSVLELNPEAFDIASSLDNERAAGNVRGPMHGIPVLLKDNIATGDQMHTAAGAAAMLAWNPDRDAFLVSQLRDAGAVVMGKANLSEWANYVDPCMPNGFSTTGGQTQNPYGPFETYGSSSGSAVSVAADLTTVSVGSETQGSILLPAGINSVVGLKTSMGMVSRDYVIPLLPMQDVPGPMGRSVTDVAVLLSAMTGVDANDFTTSGNPLVGTDFTQFLTPDSLKDLKVGLPVWNEQAFEQFFADFDITDEETQGTFREIYAAEAESLRATGEMLSAAGVTVVEFPRSEIPPNATKIAQRLEYGYKDAINSFLADLGEDAPVASLEEIIAFNNEDAANRAPYGQGHLEAAENTTLTAKEYATMAQEDNGFARNALDIIFDNYDIDVIVHEVGQLYAPAGYPALTIPSGYAEDGTPLSVVFVGQFWSEPQLLTVGYAFEQAAQARIAPDLETTLQSIREID